MTSVLVRARFRHRRTPCGCGTRGCGDVSTAQEMDANPAVTWASGVWPRELLSVVAHVTMGPEVTPYALPLRSNIDFSQRTAEIGDAPSPASLPRYPGCKRQGPGGRPLCLPRQAQLPCHRTAMPPPAARDLQRANHRTAQPPARSTVLTEPGLFIVGKKIYGFSF